MLTWVGDVTPRCPRNSRGSWYSARMMQQSRGAWPICWPTTRPTRWTQWRCGGRTCRSQWAGWASALRSMAATRPTGPPGPTRCPRCRLATRMWWRTYACFSAAPSAHLPNKPPTPWHSRKRPTYNARASLPRRGQFWLVVVALPRPSAAASSATPCAVGSVRRQPIWTQWRLRTFSVTSIRYLAPSLCHKRAPVGRKPKSPCPQLQNSVSLATVCGRSFSRCRTPRASVGAGGGWIHWRGAPLERAAARMCREAGARVATNVFLCDMNVGLPLADSRRIDVLANGLPLRQGAQVAADTTLVCPPTRSGEPRPGAEREPGLALQTAANRKRRAVYSELVAVRRCKLVVLGVEVGVRIGQEALGFVRQVANAKARRVPARLRAVARQANIHRWTRTLAVAAQRAFAMSLLELPLARWPMSVMAPNRPWRNSRLPAPVRAWAANGLEALRRGAGRDNHLQMQKGPWKIFIEVKQTRSESLSFCTTKKCFRYTLVSATQHGKKEGSGTR